MEKEFFTCEADAKKAGSTSFKNIKYHQIVFQTTPADKKIKKDEVDESGRRILTGYKIKVQLSENKNKINIAAQKKGRFMLAANEMNEIILKNSEILYEYKGQSKVEKGFKFIKNNSFEVSTVYLKKPSRIEALMVIMALCLMGYSFAEHTLRKSLLEHSTTVPDQKNKPTKKPAMKYMARKFYGIHVLQIVNNIAENDKFSQIAVSYIVINIKEELQEIIQYFGPKAEQIYN